MAGNTQMNENERGVMALHGLTGGIIATVLLLSIVGILTFLSITVQADNATNYYQINQDLHALKMNSPENMNHRTMK
ncbi:MAG: DUF4006 domain-containing protein [Epsilonproteobacteria bacterium]|nr:MAG: DUF4006 domain-containing protein [Campylobacterota bacterium]